MGHYKDWEGRLLKRTPKLTLLILKGKSNLAKAIVTDFRFFLSEIITLLEDRIGLESHSERLIHPSDAGVRFF